MATFEEIWELRDNINRQVWGDFEGVYARREEQESGPYVYVIEVPPERQPRADDRWTYTTGGLALPWEGELDDLDADDYLVGIDEVSPAQQAIARTTGREVSGHGIEIVMHTPMQAPWAVHVLANIGKYVLRTGDSFDAGHRIPLQGPIIAESGSEIMVILLAPPGDRHRLFKLPSGYAQWLVAIGITLPEWEYSQENGSAALLELLRLRGIRDLTDPWRSSII